MALNYFEINGEAIKTLLSIKKQVSTIEEALQYLVELRVSQINGCAYCVNLHSIEARKAGVPQQKLDCLTVWKESDFFSERECAALSWAESVTRIYEERQPEEKLDLLLETFSEKEAVDLTFIVSTMNALNRIAISCGDKPERMA
ncbi:carboxymuconolactone decarboxylase family protein [Aestuariispira ectoiniformans]|uniref:carboxymuconolactone decarboxylase family protein n=1 Tax=Aestuariispira ectoiniformans TaxID=2775080 RepID=UPI00223BA0A9|nr:carboxymuconolactone decarboxylase family protein [Aestuariispira ectoiniformans]